MKKFILAAILMIAALPLMATTVAFVSTEQSIQQSEIILIGRVLSVEHTYDREGQIVRNITVAVSDVLKGEAERGSNFIVRAWGGVKDGVRDEAVGEANYKKGERVLLQLENIDGAYHTLGLSFGKWNVEKDNVGREIIRRDLSGLMGVKTDKSPVPVMLELRQMKDLVQKVERERMVR
jgi:hypothetical protein